MPFDFLTGMYTGTATYVLFEAEKIAAFGSEHGFWLGEGETVYGWYADRSIQLYLMQKGWVGCIDVGMDGAFLFRITDGRLTEEEEQRVLQIEENIWLEVTGKDLIFGAAEALPVHLDDPEEFVEEFGMSFSLDPGRYHIIVYRLIGQHGDENEENEGEDEEKGERLDGLRLPAYIVQIRPFAEGEIPPRIEHVPVLSPLR
jgi:hypothetical protein